jgi:hypothetical protein
MHRFAGLDGDRLRPQLAGSAARAARAARPVPAPASLRRVEPLAAVAEPSELTVTPLADGDGAAVTHRVGGAVR